MKLVVRKRALNAILSTAIFVEAINTPESGHRWANELFEAIESLAKVNPKLRLCKNKSLAKFKFSCFAHKDWIIVYKATKSKFEVCRFIHDSRLN